MKKKLALILMAAMMLVLAAGCVESDAEVIEVGDTEFVTIYGATGEKCVINSTEHNTGTYSESIMLGYLNVPEETLEEYHAYLKDDGWELIDEQEMVNYNAGIGITGLNGNAQRFTCSSYYKDEGRYSIYIYDYLNGQVAVLYDVSE